MMRSFTILSLAASILAQQTTCPGGGGPATVNGYSFCCPGFINDDQNGFSCVLGCTVGYEPCYPFCTEAGTTNQQTTQGSCIFVPATASDYSYLVGYSGNAEDSATFDSAAATNSAVVRSSSAPVNTFASTTAAVGNSRTAVSVASPTLAGTQPTTGPAGVLTQQSSVGMQTTSTTTPTSVSHGAAAVMTAAPFLIVGALAGVVLA